MWSNVWRKWGWLSKKGKGVCQIEVRISSATGAVLNCHGKNGWMTCHRWEIKAWVVMASHG